MQTYFVQYKIYNIPKKYLESYFAELEKNIKNQHTLDIKHAFMSDGKVFINVYLQGQDKQLVGKDNLNKVFGIAAESINFKSDEDIHVHIEKVELI